MRCRISSESLLRYICNLHECLIRLIDPLQTRCFTLPLMHARRRQP